MPGIISRVIASVALPAAAAALIGGAAIGLAGTANASNYNDTPGTSVQMTAPSENGPSTKKPYWTHKREFYNNNKSYYK